MSLSPDTEPWRSLIDPALLRGADLTLLTSALVTLAAAGRLDLLTYGLASSLVLTESARRMERALTVKFIESEEQFLSSHKS